jgi:Ca2+-binding RTX toxin-like protein
MDSATNGMNAAFVATPWVPIDFVVAVWLGMSHQDIVAGLADGRVIPPAGQPVGWIPPAWANEGFGAPPASGGDAPGTTGSGNAGGAGANDSGSGDSGPEGGGTGDFALDRDHVAALYKQLDPTLSDAAFAALWNRAGETDAARASDLFGYLRRTLLDESDVQPQSGEAKPADTLEAQAARLSAFLAGANHQGMVVDLAGKDGAKLLRLAKTDPGYRYALEQLDSIAIVGNRALTAIHDSDGELDRFDPDTGEANLSDAWLSDRAKFLAWKLQTDAGGDAQSDSDSGWTFLDRTTLGADGKPLRLEIAGKSDSAPQNQVIFGNEDPNGEMLKGATTTDRIYGGGGDDVLRGNAGDDHLEGGKGDDLVLGGVGNDELTGDQGDDELDGGNGADRLDAGSGDDTLLGGRGDDRLAGGAGRDTYVIDPGDGSDTIIDSDGDGELQFDGSVLAGATALKDGKYVSDDGKAIFSFDGDAEEGGTLTITFYDKANRGDGDSPTNTVRIKDWKNGDLGIALGDGTAAALAAATADDSSAAAVPPVTTSTPGVDQGSDNGDNGSSGQDAGGTGIGSSGNADSGTAEGNGADAEANALVSVEIAANPAAPSRDAAGSDVSGSAVDAAPDLYVNPSSAHGPTGVLLDALLKVSATSNVSDSLLRPETVDAAVVAFSAIAEPPDIVHSTAASSSPVVGVTAEDVANAMLDFHDASDATADHGTMESPQALPTLNSTEASALTVPTRRPVTNYVGSQQ